MWEVATRGTLILKSPTLVPVAGKTSALVMFVDIMPTMAGLAGLDLPP
jgi:arylsulfatase A-like enzyme